MQFDAVANETVAVDPVPPIAPTAPFWVGLGIVAVGASLMMAARVGARLRAGVPVVARRPHADVPWHGIDVAVVAVAYLAAASVAGACLPPGPAVVAVLIANLAALAVTTLFAVWHLHLRGADLRSLGWDSASWRDDVRLGVGGLALVVAPLLGLATLLDRIVPYEHPIVDLLLADRSGLTLAVVIVSAVVAAPIAEELFFRRILQGWLESRLPAPQRGGAVLASAGLFAAAHMGQGLAPVPLFVLGIVLGWMALQTGSIVGCTLLHALFNAVSVGLVLLTTRPTG
jgi:membrane protease YdiL (CAAX protease family)